MKKILSLILLIVLLIFITGVCFAESGQPTSITFGWNADTGWLRVIVDEAGHFIVQTDTDSIIKSILDTVTTYMTLSQYDGLFVLISTGNETTIARLDTINTELIKHYVLSSTNTAAILTELIEAYVLSSTGTDAIVTRLNTLIDGVTVFVTAGKVSIAVGTNSVNVALMSSDAVGPGTWSFATRAFQYGWDAINGQFVRLRADRILKVQKTISTIHSEVHDGHMFNTSYVWETLADDTTGVFLIDTSTKNAHMVINVMTGGDALVKIWEGATVISSGTGLSEINMNRVSGLTSMANVYHTPTSCDPSTLIFQTFIGGGAGTGPSGTVSGGAIRIDTEWIFKKSELYVVSVENETGGATFASIVVEWYEEELD